MKLLKMLCALASTLALTPVVSFAQQYANLARDANLRAGPARDYPVVVELPAGMSVWVDGCINGYRWCDVTVGPDRGWVYAGNIIYPYQGAPVPLLNYGAVIGIGIIAFSLGDYWDNHYRTRPWYPQRQHWIDRHQPVFRADVGNVRPFPSRPPTRPEGVQRPPHEQPPAGAPHPEQQPLSARAPHPPAVTQPPHQGRPPKETQRPSHDQQRGGDKRPQWEELPGGGKK